MACKAINEIRKAGGRVYQKEITTLVMLNMRCLGDIPVELPERYYA